MFTEPGQLGVNYGAGARRPRPRRRVDREPVEVSRSFLIINAPTLLEGLRTLVLWAEFTGRTPVE